MKKIFAKVLFLLLMTACTYRYPLPVEIYNKAKENLVNQYDPSACGGGTGATDYYDFVTIDLDVNNTLTLDELRYELLTIQNEMIKVANNEPLFLQEFKSDHLDRNNVHVALCVNPGIKNPDWEINSVGSARPGLHYLTSAMLEDRHWFYVDDQKVTHHVIEKIDAPKEYFFTLGEETYEEAERIAFGEGPFEKVITFTQWGNYSVPLELHGPWGFFIERTVAEQIRSGDYIYYAEVDGKKHKLAAKEHQVVVEATGQPIVEVWTPLKQKHT